MTRYKSWLFFLAVLLLTACSKDLDVAGGAPVPTPTDPTPEMPVVSERPLQLVAATRAQLSTDDVSPAGEAFDPIQIFLMAGEQETAITHKTEGEFTYDASATPFWKSNIGLKNPYNCIYGFSPATAASATISTLVQGTTSYHSGAILEMTNISPVTGSDICVIVGVKHGANAGAVVNVQEKQGVFYFEKGVSDNYVSLLLDHIFAKIDFRIKIDPEYHKLRAIKVKKIELLSDKTLKKVTVPLAANTEGESPIGDIIYTLDNVADGAERPSGTIYDYTLDTNEENKDGVDLPEDNSCVIPGYFAPGGDDENAIGRNLLLRFTYDVYAYDVFDNNKETRVREDCVAINHLPPILTLEEQQLKRGQSTTITLTVKPTYLYTLSESELDNPTIVVE